MGYKDVVTATPDIPDNRDWFYRPALIPLKPKIEIPDNLYILNQGSEGACTGFATAAVINLLMQKAERTDDDGKPLRVSPRMIYAMAKRNDEWPGEKYEGSSLRGAIRGWKNMGVCSEALWKYKKDKLTVDRAKDARKNTIGAYYRLRPVISDFHAALNEVGAIAVSACVHAGWWEPKRVIQVRKTIEGGHAFAIVGYNDAGFWVQNSWGTDWGTDGVALWKYEDWIENIMDAWVVRLALSTPNIFGKTPPNSTLLEEQEDAVSKRSVDRHAIAGHFVHIDDGRFADQGKYWSTKDDVENTVELVAKSDYYKHIVFYAHGGLNSPEASARRIDALKDGFMRNRVYPFHFMYDTGLVEEVKDVILRKADVSRARFGRLFDQTDRFIEGLLRSPGTAVWNEMKRGAQKAFTPSGAGKKAIDMFVDALAGARHKKKIHLVGHSTGAILLGYLLHCFRNLEEEIDTCHLMAPACSVKMYRDYYVPVLKNEHWLTMRRLHVYNLNDRLEQRDDVLAVYRKSLLYLVSNSFQPENEEELLGLEIYNEDLPRTWNKARFFYSDGNRGPTTSLSHGGFDNDRATMNHILRTIVGGRISAFSEDEMEY